MSSRKQIVALSMLLIGIMLAPRYGQAHDMHAMTDMPAMSGMTDMQGMPEHQIGRAHV